MSEATPSGKKKLGKPFTKNDPRRARGGRPKKTTDWKAAEDELRDAIPRLMLMRKSELSELLAKDPTGAEMLAAKYIHEHAPKTVERFLGKMPDILTGKDGQPLIPAAPVAILPPLDFKGWKPEQVDAFIAATAAAAKVKKSG